MTAPLDPELLPESWAMQARRSAVAGKFKSDLDRWRAVAGVAAVLGAILETAAASLFGLGDSAAGARTALGLAGAIVLAGVPVAVTRTTKDHVQDWVRARRFGRPTSMV